ncbi:MAG: sialidase family protein [Terriglobia bacterium]
MTNRRRLVSALPLLWITVCLAACRPAQNSVRHFPNAPLLVSEFIFEHAPFAQCHASTLVELPDEEKPTDRKAPSVATRLLAAWFGGAREGDRSVAIWGAIRHNGEWSAPRVLARKPGIPCWNPVLFAARDGKIWLFFKYGSSPKTWKGAYRTSRDGVQWSDIRYLPDGILGPAKDKPVTLADGTILAGTSVETAWSWTCWVDRTTNDGASWQLIGPIKMHGWHHGIIQPTIWQMNDGEERMLVRSSHDIGWIAESTSKDDGKHWSTPVDTSLPNPNSGIDAVKLKDGAVALAYNHARRDRSPLNLAFSFDDGKTWTAPLTIESGPGEFSYPAIIQSRDGKLHITYTWNRLRIKHVVVNPATAEAVARAEDRSPARPGEPSGALQSLP